MSIGGSGADFTARAARSTHVVFGLIGGLLVALGLFAALRTGHGWRQCAELTALTIFSAIWIRAFRIDVSNGVVRYRTLFGGSRSLPLSRIRSADISIGPEAPFGPFYRLTLRPVAGSAEKPIVINMKVFSRPDLDRLIDVLGSKFQGRRRYAVFERHD